MRTSLIAILFLGFNCYAIAQNPEEKTSKTDSLENQIRKNLDKIAALELKLMLMENTIESIKENNQQQLENFKENNNQQLEYYKENQSNISFMVNLFIVILGGAFVLFTYLFKRPDEILRKIKEGVTQSDEIIDEAKYLLEKLDFQYEHQESIFILNKKSLFDYTENDWNLVELYANNAKDVIEEKRRANDWIFIGLSEYRKTNITESIFAFEKATEINPEYEIAWKHLGNAYDKNEEYQKSIEAFYKVIELNPNNHIAFNNLGIEYNAIGNFEEAERNFMKSIELNPNNCYAYTNYLELCLVNDIPFKEEMVNDFKFKFSNHLNANASFEMLNIYSRIINEEDFDLQGTLNLWKDKYKSVGWDESYRKVESWIGTKEGVVKSRLMKALNFFSSDSAFRNL